MIENTFFNVISDKFPNFTTSHPTVRVKSSLTVVVLLPPAIACVASINTSSLSLHFCSFALALPLSLEFPPTRYLLGRGWCFAFFPFPPVLSLNHSSQKKLLTAKKKYATPRMCWFSLSFFESAERGRECDSLSRSFCFRFGQLLRGDTRYSRCSDSRLIPCWFGFRSGREFFRA